MYLITYMVQDAGRHYYGYAIIEGHPVDFVIECNEYPDAPYYLINAQPMTDEQIKMFKDGELELKGM